MPAAIRGRGTLVAVGYPIVTGSAILLWIEQHGLQVSTSLPAALLLVVLTGLTVHLEVMVSPRMGVTAAGGFQAAAALIGGPLIGALAGLALELFDNQRVSRKLFALGGAHALEGFGIGLVGQEFLLHGGSEASALAGVGLLTGLLLNTITVTVVGLDRGIDLRDQFAVWWRPELLAWLLPWPPLAAFLYVYWSAPAVALALAGGLLLAIWLADRLRRRLEQRLAEERGRARHDALTGAPNRYALDEALAAEHARILRGGHPAAVCFLEIDRFKAVNTDYGFFTADQLLVGLYRRLRGRLRASDLIFRWGGDEFVLIAPDQPDLHEFAERLRLLVAHEAFAIGEQQIAITVSVGAAVLDETRTPEAVVEAAGRLVQIAKEKRNAVEVESGQARVVSRADQSAIGAT